MGIRVHHLKVEGRVNPLGLGTQRPRLSWIIVSDEPSQEQTAYQVQVASTTERLGSDRPDIWDSGVVPSRESVLVPYGGPSLASNTTYHWRVRVQDRQGRFSDWSESACWSMGLLTSDEWQGQWIGRELEAGEVLPAPTYLRKEFHLDRPVRRAYVYATALGVYELRLNGDRVGDGRFAPGWTDYAKRVQYQTYEVTHLLKKGDNAFGTILGTGWYAGHVGMMGRHIYGTIPRFLMQLMLEFEDGTEQIITTDDTWTMSTGPLIYSDIIKGERYDARLEEPGWDRPGFASIAWQPVTCYPPCQGILTAQEDEPIRVMEMLHPVKMWRTERGTFIFDLGQNIAGWVRIRLRGEAGQTVMIEHAEMLDADGTLYTANLRKAVQKDIYILRGSGKDEVYEPRFTYHGFRYVEVEGADDLDEHSLVGCAAYSAMAPAGLIETSDERVNRLYHNIVWGQKGNFFSVPTDCPQRDERLGWTGDAQVFARTASYNMNVAAFFRKYMIDITDAQREDGAFPDTAPDAGWSEFKKISSAKWFAPDNAGWGDAGVIIPWTMYLMYGDRRILEDHYEAMKRWVEYLKRNSDGWIRPDYANHADWLSIGEETPKDVLATQYFAYSVSLLARIAEALGRMDDAATYRQLFEAINAAFVDRYVSEDGTITGDTQTVYVLALSFRMLPQHLAEKAVHKLLKRIEANNWHLSTGFLGVSCLLPVLSDHGHHDLACRLLLTDTFPSWLYSVKHGATTIWERWDGWTEERGFQTPSMNSFNHYSLGSVGEWMYRYLAGIEPDPASPGFRRIRIAPRPCPGLPEVRGSYHSEYGLISTHLRCDEGRRELTLQVAIPVNTTAIVSLPGEAREVSGDAAAVGLTPGERTYEIGSGTYGFVCKLG
jgi:alpha-L-rhamnosidase